MGRTALAPGIWASRAETGFRMRSRTTLSAASRDSLALIATLLVACASVSEPATDCARSTGEYSVHRCWLVTPNGAPELDANGGRILHGPYSVTVKFGQPLIGEELEAHLADHPDQRWLAESTTLYDPPQGHELHFITGHYNLGEADGRWEWFAANGELLLAVTYRSGDVRSCEGVLPPKAPPFLVEERLASACR